MTRKSWFLLVCALVVLSIVSGCGTSSAPTPTKAAATVAPPVVTVVITATLPPPTATQPVPTITPIPTIALTTTVAANTPVAVKPTNTAGAPRPTATRRPNTPTTVAVAATATPLPNKYPGPRLIGPVYDPGLGRLDERHNPGDTLVFQWMAVGPLGPNECYVLRVDFTPGQGDAFLICDSSLTQAAPGATVQFTLYKPTQAGPNYAGLLSPESGDATVKWYVQVAKDQGKGTGPSDPSGVRHNVIFLSPRSSVYQFPLKAQ